MGSLTQSISPLAYDTKIKDFKDWIKLDLEYIDNWSLKNDFIIALKTIPVILKGTGK